MLPRGDARTNWSRCASCALSNLRTSTVVAGIFARRLGSFALRRGPGFPDALEIDAGAHAHAVEREDEVLRGEVAGGAGRVGAAAEAGDGRIEIADAALEADEHVGERGAARVVQVQGEAIGGHLVETHNFFIAVGLCVAAVLFYMEAKRRGELSEQMIWIVAGSLCVEWLERTTCSEATPSRCALLYATTYSNTAVWTASCVS